MSQGFGRTKRRIAEAKRQKREDKRRRQQVRKHAPAGALPVENPPELQPESLPPDPGVESPAIS